MKILITGKNINVGDRLTKLVETKFGKLDKYFSQDVKMNVNVWSEKERQGVEATIFAKGTIFRAEDVSMDLNVSIDRVADKLSSQLSKYKTKLQKKYKGRPHDLVFEEIPDEEDFEEALEDEFKEVKRKSFDIKPMNIEEAILQMELLGHSFFVFINVETETVNVVYKRKDGKYGLLEPTY